MADLNESYETLDLFEEVIPSSYKLIWLGFPVLVVGTTDKARQFHPFGI